MSDRKVISAIQKISGTFNEDKVFMMSGTVKSIEGNTCTCYIDDDLELPNCQLQAAVCDGLLIIPEIGSNVVILNSKKNDPCVVQYSDIYGFYIQVGISSLEMQKDGSIALNDGSYEGLVRVADLTTKLNNMESKINQLIGLFNSHVHLVSAVGSPTAPTITPVVGTLIPTKKIDIENSKITHGI